MKLNNESLKDGDLINKLIKEYFNNSSFEKLNEKQIIIYDFLSIIDETKINDNLFLNITKNVKVPSIIYFQNNISKFTYEIDDERLIIWLCFLFPNPLVLNFILWYIQYLIKNNLIQLPVNFNSFNSCYFYNDNFKSNDIIEKEILPNLKYQIKDEKNKIIEYLVTLNFETGRTLLY